MEGTTTIHKKLPNRNGRGVQKIFMGESGVLLLAGDLGEKLLGVFCHLALAASAAHRYRNCCSGIWIVVAATNWTLAISGFGDLGEKSGRILFKLGQAPPAAKTNLDLDGSATIRSFSFHRADFVHWASEGGEQGQHQSADKKRDNFHRLFGVILLRIPLALKLSSPPLQWHANPGEGAGVNSAQIFPATIKTCIYDVTLSARGYLTDSVLVLRSLLGQAMRMIRQTLLLLVLFGSPLYSNDSKGEIRHSFLGLGKGARSSIIAEDGTVSWKIDLPASDGWVLPNGNVLLAVYPCQKYPRGGVAEIERATNRTVFSYQGQQKEISTVQLLPDGNFLVAELGPEPRARTINRKGEVLHDMPLSCQKGNAHMQTRMLRRLPDGNYIAPHLLDFAVKEYNRETGAVLKTFPTDDRGREKRDWPFTAIRLADGNTLIGCTNGNRVIEVDSQGAIVWKVDNEDLGKELLDDACGVQRLPNGNTVITSYHASGNRVKLTEVTREKKVVWTYRGGKHGFHHFQVLTTNGKPLKDNTMK